ncbi:hypothetical protein CPC08DRAFT_407290 [Agrocybe pediades]|nr:hypothetical protein CPC08DRAFT_407290 [Agrocybe pediades]
MGIMSDSSTNSPLFYRLAKRSVLPHIDSSSVIRRFAFLLLLIRHLAIIALRRLSSLQDFLLPLRISRAFGCYKNFGMMGGFLYFLLPGAKSVALFLLEFRDMLDAARKIKHDHERQR